VDGGRAPSTARSSSRSSATSTTVGLRHNLPDGGCLLTHIRATVARLIAGFGVDMRPPPRALPVPVQYAEEDILTGGLESGFGSSRAGLASASWCSPLSLP
jgi:hypothetical protein